MWYILLVTVLAFTGFSDANIICPTSKQCECEPKINEYVSQVTCHREKDRRSQVLWLKVEAENHVVFQCTPGMQYTDFDLLDGLQVRPLELIVMSFCPLPNKPFLQFFQSFNISKLSRLTYRNAHVNNTLDRSQFTGLANLTWLTLNSCGINGLPADIFLDVPSLEMLDLRDNANNLTNLRILNLWSNKLENLTRETFTGLHSVESLELSLNKLSTLPHDVFAEMPNIKQIGLNGNIFKTLPGELFSYLSHLKKIKLNNNIDLGVLPSGLLANLTDLEEIYLNGCGLASLPEDIFWGSPQIKNLSLQYNELITLPDKLFRDSSEMVFLNLGYNQLEELPDLLFMNVRNLKVLNLEYNHLTNITKNLFMNMGELLELNMGNNRLHYIDRLAFAKLPHLRKLDFSNNQLTMQDDVFHDYSVLKECVNIEEMNLAHNNITEIFADWTVLTILRNLNLGHNNIKSLSEKELHFISSLVTVDVTYNKISAIRLYGQVHPSIYTAGNSYSPPVKRIFKLEGNPIICDCQIYQLLRYLKLKMDPEVRALYELEAGNLNCAGPNYLTGISVNELMIEKFECPIPQAEMCPKPCTCTMRPYDFAFLINCSEKQLKVVPQVPALSGIQQVVGKWYQMTLNHTELILSKNRLTMLPNSTDAGYSQVTKLYLSSNNISTISKENVPPVIQVMELHNNNLTHLNEPVLDVLANSDTLERITLHRNPWQCDCNAKGLLMFLQEHYTKVLNLPNMTCNDKSHRTLRNLTIIDLCPDSNDKIIAASVIVASLGIMFGVIAALYYYYNREVKVWLFAHGMFLWFVTEEELDKDKLYDAFISYSHRDEEFVVNELVPQLESGPHPFKLCLHYRDWIAGELIPNQIARSVDDSRRTLVVLSTNFVESVWGRMEFRTAHSQALSEGRARVIVLLYGDVGPLDQLDPELKAYLSMNTYVKWGDPWFWDKLRYALPHPQDPMKEIELKAKRNSDSKLGLTIHSAPPAATTPPTETIKNPLDITKLATNGHATLVTEVNGHVNQCFVKSLSDSEMWLYQLCRTLKTSIMFSCTDFSLESLEYPSITLPRLNLFISANFLVQTVIRTELRINYNFDK
ncbi:hypothetical protein L9F63_010076, partial [Diploptera punctata]